MFNKIQSGKNFTVVILTLSLIFSIVPAVIAEDYGASSKWVEDLEYLVDQLPELHVNLYDKITESEFLRRATDLKKRVPGLTDNEIIVEVSRLIASAGDAHTTLFYRPKQSYPFTFRWFETGIVTLMTTENYRQTLNQKLVSINGVEIGEVVSRLKQVISHENQAWLKKMVPQYLVFPTYLNGLGVTEADRPAEFTFIDENGDEFTVEVNPIEVASGASFIKDFEYSPLYMKNQGELYWYEYLTDKKVLYFKYNLCRSNKDRPLNQVTAEMINIIDEGKVEKLIVDLRGNSGGNSGLLNPFIDKISQNEELNRSESIFVLVDRNTFSSAVINAMDLNNKTNATIVGEPTGGKPNHYGEVRYFKLPNSGLTVYYSTKYFKFTEKDPSSLFPDREVRLTLEAFLNNRDPVLETVLS